MLLQYTQRLPILNPIGVDNALIGAFYTLFELTKRAHAVVDAVGARFTTDEMLELTHDVP